MSERIPADERLMNLVVGLLGTETGLTRREIFGSVSGYVERQRDGAGDDALERMFERDKETLVGLGVRIDVIGDPSNPTDMRGARYRIPREDNALPDDVEFTAEELALLHVAAEAWGGAAMSRDARAGVRKIRALGIDVDEPILGFAPRLSVREAAFAPLQEAIDDAREVRFAYLKPGQSQHTARRVRPLALVQFEGRWHLHAHDLDAGAPRTFLLSRVASAVRQTGSSFDPAERDGAAERVLAQLSELASRQRAVIEVTPGSEGALRLARRAVPTDGAAGLVVPFVDADVFADELASYGPEVRVVEPAALRDRVTARLAAVRIRHEGAPASVPAEAPAAPARRRTPIASSDRVSIYLTLVPWLLEHGEQPVSEIARAFDVSEAEMRKMVTRLSLVGEPAGGMYTGDMFDIDWDLLETADVVRLTRAVGIERVQRFTTREAAALLSGLRLVEAMPGVADPAVVVGLRAKLGRAASARPAEPVVASPLDDLRETLSRAVLERRAVRFSYRRPATGEATVRTVEPTRLLLSGGSWYLQGWCRLREASRTFLLERMGEVEVTDERVEPRDAPTHAMFTPGDSDLVVTVCFPEAIEGQLADYLDHASIQRVAGDVVARIPVADAGVVKRLAARGGGAIEVVAPTAAREATRLWAEAGERAHREG